MEFSNSSKLPIHEVYIYHDKEKISALNAKWTEKRCFTKYVPLKFRGGKIFDSFDEDEWMGENKLFNKDLEWILSLKFHRFWSHVIYDKEFLNPLLYFLQESTPFYIPLRDIFYDNEPLVELYEKICRNALVIICRLITNRESDEEFMTKEKQAELIYGNYVISVPMLFDIVALYGYNNRELVQKIVTTVLKIEPKYSNDLKTGIKFARDTLGTIKEQISLIEKENRDLYDSYEDVSLYLMNISSTINLLIELVPNDIKNYCSHDLHLEQAIAIFYDNTVPTLYQNSTEVDSSAWFLNFINYSRIELIHAFRNLLNRNLLAIFNANEKARLKIADEVLSSFTEVAGYRVFIADYIKFYPIEMDLDVLTQSVKKIDKIKLEFVKDAYKVESFSSNVHNGYHVQSNNTEKINDYEIDELEMEGACALPLKKEGPQLPERDSEDFIQLETSKILELFPDYGAGYIRRLLAFYDNNSETVLAKMLDETLDEALRNYDKQEPYIPPETDPIPTSTTTANIADRYVEEFGGHVLKNGKNLTKKQPKSYADLINDKSHVNDMRDRYKQYNLVSDVIEDKDNEYDDEYDDSYEVFADTEPRIHIRGRMREALPDDIDSESSEESGDENQQPKRSPLDFCENPEIIRARREQRFQSKMAKKQPAKPVETKTRDVVGNAKGQGQSNDVLRNRAQKNTNKSSRANHNRKAGSTFKQSRGMY
ncbi:activating signal cointegrator 1 complex subunit 2 [Chironomus tepperi]|uniref:activating signal cointegrator 1 complex subunit 2 n=1 Tax=Chironomus tepperi TaxID=113505 RepID=UPI00391F94E1